VDYESVYGSGYLEIQSRQPNLNALKALIGPWTPIPLSETIAAIVEYEAQRLEAENEAIVNS
jgi:hypothetical protein